MRKGVLVAALALAVALVGTAVAAFPQDSVKLYTGCLNSGGNITYVKEGDSPLQPCPSAKQVLKLSGGDITSVTAGSGLSGGGTNGAVTLSLDAAHSLPTACANGDVPKSTGAGAWNCGADEDTTYSAGTGLALNGTQLSLRDPAVSRKQDTVDCSQTPAACKRGEGLFGGGVACPDGSVLLSGGAQAGTPGIFGSTPDFVLTASAPGFDDAGRPSGWYAWATFTRDVTAGTFTVIVSALCSQS